MYIRSWYKCETKVILRIIFVQPGDGLTSDWNLYRQRQFIYANPMRHRFIYNCLFWQVVNLAVEWWDFFCKRSTVFQFAVYKFSTLSNHLHFCFGFYDISYKQTLTYMHMSLRNYGSIYFPSSCEWVARRN